MNKMTITLFVNAIEIENADYAIKRQIRHMKKLRRHSYYADDKKD